MPREKRARQPPRTSDPSRRQRPPYLAAAAAAAAVFTLYAVTLAPTTQFWDASEYIAVAEVLGIPHPPGNPLFVLLAGAWSRLLAPLGLEPAVRVNLFGAAMSAAAHGLWFLVAHRALAGLGAGRRSRLVGAAAAVALSATAFTVWNQSNVNEKVYTVSLATVALVAWLASRWRDRIEAGIPARAHLVLVAYLLALSVGNHLMAFLAAPALLVFVLRVRPRALADPGLVAAGAAVTALGLSVHLFLPIRAALDPVINEADPTCDSVAGAVTSVLTLGYAGCPPLSGALRRSQYAKPPVSLDPTLYPGEEAPRPPRLIAAQLANYVQYFDWQWARSLGAGPWFGWPRPLVTLAFLGLGLLGASWQARGDPDAFSFSLVLFLTLSLGLTVYLNFRYGFSYPDPGIGFGSREVRERDYFFLLGYSVWGLWAGLGVHALWTGLADRIRGRAGHRAPLFAAPALLLALVPLALNWGDASRAGDYRARDWAYDMLMSVDPYGVLITRGDNDTFPLWYLQEVEGVRRDVTVVVSTYLNTGWYARQVRRLTRPCGPGVDPESEPTRALCQRPFETDGLHPAMRARFQRPPEPPTRSALSLTDDQIDRIAASPFRLGESVPIRAGRLRAAVPEGTILLPSEAFVLTIVRSALGDRPVHFVGADAPVRKLGLQPYLVRQGLAFRLNEAAVAAGADGVHEIMAGAVVGHYVDLPWTETLLEEIFIRRYDPRAGGWPDPATSSVPAHYGWAHQAVAEAYTLLGLDEQAREHTARARYWLDHAAGGHSRPPSSTAMTGGAGSGFRP